MVPANHIGKGIVMPKVEVIVIAVIVDVFLLLLL